MHRIDTDGHVANLFNEGDPAVPRLPTQVDKHILNAFQEEIANAIVSAGIALVKGTNTQLRDALGLNSGSPGLIARFFANTLNITPAGTAKAALLQAATNSGGAVKITGTSTGSALELATTGAASEVLKMTPAANTVNDIAATVAAGVVQFTGANLASADGHNNKLSGLGLVKGWAHFAWANAAPTLASGMNMAAPGNPAAGQIQVNLTNGITSGAVVVIGTAGAAAWQVVALNSTGLIQIQDNAGAAVPFGSTTGFAFVLVMGRQ